MFPIFMLSIKENLLLHNLMVLFTDVLKAVEKKNIFTRLLEYYFMYFPKRLAISQIHFYDMSFLKRVFIRKIVFLNRLINLLNVFCIIQLSFITMRVA